MDEAERGATRKPLSVGELTRHIKANLEQRFPDILLEGEISNFKSSAAGHYYFTLKDQEAVIQAVMFRNRTHRLSFEPADGKLVIVTGNVSVYARRGNYQIICESMRLAGVGSILAMIEERKQRLAEEGLFDDERKVPVPTFPERVAVVTSPTGAAIRDILQVLGRRHSGVNLVVAPTLVQGDEAPQSIAAQIRRVDRHKLGDVIIVTRGGGSLEDLLPFSDEAVVRAIVEAETPTIAAVGHEIDLSLAELAADRRAPTPSAAAEIVSIDRAEYRRHVLNLGHTIIQALKQKMDRARFATEQFSSQRLHESFDRLVQPLYLRFDEAREGLQRNMQERITSARHRLTVATKELEGLSPQAVLERGFAIVTREDDGSLVTDAGDTSVGDRVLTRFARSAVTTEVREQHDYREQQDYGDFRGPTRTAREPFGEDQNG
ncbi:MAG: exodeoxyribonuclease VII large subunit [Spirochaetota bacterium]